MKIVKMASEICFRKNVLITVATERLTFPEELKNAYKTPIKKDSHYKSNCKAT